MTPEQALQNVEIICRQYGGYTLATARAVEESLAVLREGIGKRKHPSAVLDSLVAGEAEAQGHDGGLPQ